MVFEVSTKEVIAPTNLEPNKYSLSPLDICCFCAERYLTWAFFYTFDVDSNLVKKSLDYVAEKFPLICGRVKSCPQTRYLIDVDKSKKQEYGFSFTEQTSEITIAEAILRHSQIKIDKADYPVYPEVPFFMEKIDIPAALKGEASLFAVKLTHFRDGCAVNFVIAHILADGQRFAELCRAVSLAYCGKEVPERDLNRSYLWPDQLVKHYPMLLGELGGLPRQASQQKERLSCASLPEESAATEVLHFSQTTLDQMKSIARQFVPAGHFLSTNDVLVSFSWMLYCELESKIQPITNGTDLDVANTASRFLVELLKNGANIVPENYFGNASVGHGIESDGLEVKGKSILEAFSILALHVRGNVTSIRKHASFAAKELMYVYSIITSGIAAAPTDRFRAAITNLVRTPVLETDFGNGPPALVQVTAPLPLMGHLWSLGPAPKNDGVLLNIVLRSSQRQILKSSVVVRECAPTARRLYSDLSVEDLASFLRS